MSQVLKIDENNYDNEIMKSDLPVVLDLSASWCGPCRMLAPIIESLADKYPGKVKVAKLDVDESPVIAQKLGVMGVPTTVIFQNGNELDRIVGLATLDQFSEKLNSHFQL